MKPINLLIGINTDIETSLLLIKTPSVDFPFYDMPIDGSAFVKMHTVQLGAELHF